MKFHENLGTKIAILSLSTLALMGCTPNQEKAPVPTEIQSTEAKPAVPEDEDATLTLVAIQRQLESQGFDVQKVTEGAAMPYWAHVNLPQCDTPAHKVGLYEDDSPIEVIVIGNGNVASEDTYVLSADIPKSAC